MVRESTGADPQHRTYPALLPSLLVTATMMTGCRTDSAAIGNGRDPAEPTAGFTSIESPPFRVLGDEAPDVVAERARALTAAAALLRTDFFERDPEPTLEVWLLRGPAPSESRYSVGEHEVVVDLSKPDGAPVHFLVHAYMHANVPDCPVWFDEGLAALMESGVDREGHIRGQLDPRLAALQDDIRAGVLPTIEMLTALDRAGFYGERWDVHERMARYLCYHLQQEDLLRPYARELMGAQGTDSAGYATLKRMLGEDDMVAFQRRWEAWVLALEPGR